MTTTSYYVKPIGANAAAVGNVWFRIRSLKPIGPNNEHTMNGMGWEIGIKTRFGAKETFIPMSYETPNLKFMKGYPRGLPMTFEQILNDRFG